MWNSNSFSLPDAVSTAPEVRELRERERVERGTNSLVSSVETPPAGEFVEKNDGPISLVIAEGRALLCETIKVVLEGEPDLRVEALATEWHTALVLSAEVKPDVLVLDGNLPDGDGLEMITILKNRQPGIRVLFVAEGSDEGLLDAALRAGADGFVTRDGTLFDLINEIRALAHRGRFPLPSMPHRVMEGTTRLPTLLEKEL
jgi:DNA-binding NarL/FixJ family response regulator